MTSRGFRKFLPAIFWNALLSTMTSQKYPLDVQKSRFHLINSTRQPHVF